VKDYSILLYCFPVFADLGYDFKENLPEGEALATLTLFDTMTHLSVNIHNFNKSNTF